MTVQQTPIQRVPMQSVHSKCLNQMSERTDHWVDFRASTKWFSTPLYVRILVGEEHRNRTRLEAEDQISVVKTVVLFALLGWFATTITVVFGAIAAYLIKSALGIDLIDGPSWMHDFFFD